jgi:hypothetical protein
MDHLLAYRYILADNADHLTYFRRNYRKYSNNRSGSPISAGEIERLKDLPVTKVLIVSKNNKQTLDLIKNNFQELKGVKFDHNKEFVRLFDLLDHTKLILVNNLTTKFSTQFEKAFENKMIK